MQNRLAFTFSILPAVVASLCPCYHILAECPEFLPGEQVGTVQHGSINEASGIVASRSNLNVLWVHNDSGDSARVFAMDTEGNHLGIYNIADSTATDWEDIAIGPGLTPGQDYLYIGDIGDNSAARTNGVKVYRVQEPTVDIAQDPVNEWLYGTETITLHYPDGPRDAEVLMVDPATGDIYIVSKRTDNSRVYRAAYPQTSGMTMEYICELPCGWTTGGDISPLSDEIIVRGYSNAYLWPVPQGGDIPDAFDEDPCDIPLISEPQGEAIGFDAFGFGYFTVSEYTYQPIYYFARAADAPNLVISSEIENTYHLTWGEAGFFDLEFDISISFDDPDVVDVTGITEYDYYTEKNKGFFRLMRK